MSVWPFDIPNPDPAIERQALALDRAVQERAAVDAFAPGTFSLEQAYRIQRAGLLLRAARGERPVGVKLGFTSRAKMRQMNVKSLIWGALTDAMVEEEGGELAFGNYIHPRAEPEICFLTRKDIDRPLTALEAATHIEAVAPAIEIIDSRYRAFKFGLESVVADNCSAAGLVVGAWAPATADIGNRGVRLQVNGSDVELGTTAAILGHPLRAFVQATALAAGSGGVIAAGSLIMAGAATSAIALTPDTHLSCLIDGFDPCAIAIGTGEEAQ